MEDFPCIRMGQVPLWVWDCPFMGIGLPFVGIHLWVIYLCMDISLLNFNLRPNKTLH